MSPDRRIFLARAGLAVVAATTGAACGPRQDQQSRPITAVAAAGGDWEAVRRQFALSEDHIHMSALYIVSHPRPVREAIERYRRELDANPVVYLNEHNRSRTQETLSAAARYLGVDNASDIALTDSTTMGVGLVYNGLRLSPGNEVLTTEQDYYVTHEALRLAAERKGLEVRRVSLYEDITRVGEEQLVDRLLGGITPRTRAVALTWVHSSTGLKLPLAHISRALHGINSRRSRDERILLCVDGVHGFGVEDVELPDLGCDFFMAGCHKWLFGPRGTGIVWGSIDGWRRSLGTVPSFIDDGTREAWISGEEVTGRNDGHRMSPGGFKAYEHVWALSEAFKFCQALGKSRVAARTHALARQLKEGLASMPHVTLRTPMPEALSAGIVCFEIDGMDPWTAVARLRERGLIATVTPYATRYVRLAPSVRNSPAEVDEALKRIHALA